MLRQEAYEILGTPRKQLTSIYMLTDGGDSNLGTEGEVKKLLCVIAIRDD